MYLRRCYRRKDGKRHADWALVEGYRTARGPRRRVVAYLGELDEKGRLGVRRCALGRDGTWQADLFRDDEPEYVEVDLKGVRVESSRQFGGCWLGLTLWQELGLSELLNELLPPGREEELLGVPASKVNDDRLYRALDRLLPHKAALEKHLKQRLGELFELDYDLLLYDVTSTISKARRKRIHRRKEAILGGVPSGPVQTANKSTSPWW
jgi:hypothetical protein